jgi:hypothetical protein
VIANRRSGIYCVACATSRYQGVWRTAATYLPRCDSKVPGGKITGFRWHDVRHHFASRLIQHGVPLNTVRDFLGHSSVAMSLRYAHLAPDQGREAVQTQRQAASCAYDALIVERRFERRPVSIWSDLWKGRNSNPRPRHYEPSSWLKVDRKFNNLPRGLRCTLARRRTTEHNWFPQISRTSHGS